MYKVLLAFVVVLLIASCSRKEDISGTWERVDGVYKGTQIQIIPDGDGFSGKITKVNDAAKLYGYILGDIKWKDIKRTKEKNFDMLSLSKQTNKYGEDVPEYHKAVIELADINTMNVKSMFDNTGKIGDKQLWKRIK